MKNKLHYLLLSGILGSALFFRTYQLSERFMYSHDNDLASWIIKDIVFDKHLRLIGQLTSSPGIFIGPFYYYSLIPFYWAAGWDPIGSVWFSVVIGLISIFSIYYVFSRLYGRIPASIIAFLYSASFTVASTEREVVPTTPVYLWTIWFFYGVHLLFQGKKAGLLYIFVLGALVWHLNLALALLFPLPAIAIFINRRRFLPSDFIKPVLAALVLFLPFTLFEVRHNFNHFHALIQTFSQFGTGHVDLWAKAGHVWFYIARNSTRLFYWDPPTAFSVNAVPILLFVGFWLIYRFKTSLPRYVLFLYPAWIFLYLLFFTFHPINLSEYYLNGLNIVWLALASSCLAYLYRANRLTRTLVFLILGLFLYRNVQVFLNLPLNRSGYLERTAIVKYIAADAASHGYPCVAVSYMTTPGNNLGYRYLFYRQNLRVNQPKSESPVYTIVFPHSLANRLDATFGALGLILPDYSRYTPEGIVHSCSGLNSNLTDPMFGFTK